MRIKQRNYVRRGTPMRGMGSPDFCSPDFVGPVSPENISACAIAYRDQVIAEQAAEAGAPSFLSSMPSWVIPGAIGLFLLSFMKGVRR